jgi:tetratricopeptide (TPR) repeat protein
MLKQRKFGKARRTLAAELRTFSVLLQPKVHQRIQGWLRQLARTNPREAVRMFGLYQRSTRKLSRKGVVVWLKKEGVVLPEDKLIQTQVPLLKQLVRVNQTLSFARQAMKRGQFKRALRLYQKARTQFRITDKQDPWKLSKPYRLELSSAQKYLGMLEQADAIQKKIAQAMALTRFEEVPMHYTALLKLVDKTPAQVLVEKRYERDKKRIAAGKMHFHKGRIAYFRKNWKQARQQFGLYRKMFPRSLQNKQVTRWYNVAGCELGIPWAPCKNLKRK